MARRRSDYQVFVSARMRALAPHGLDESRRAMKMVAAEWRAMQGGRRANPELDDGYEDDNPRRYRRRRRRNPSNNQLLTYALAAGAIWYFFLRGRTA
jgi:hypothetical protein